MPLGQDRSPTIVRCHGHVLQIMNAMDRAIVLREFDARAWATG